MKFDQYACRESILPPEWEERLIADGDEVVANVFPGSAVRIYLGEVNSSQNGVRTMRREYIQATVQADLGTGGLIRAQVPYPFFGGQDGFGEFFGFQALGANPMLAPVTKDPDFSIWYYVCFQGDDVGEWTGAA